ncbi:uncharacterized protein Tco025E_00080 [Trypanosoma conorhini]|uniref:Uncharacterized protein n=1 Tax=Trypanosoma conorhini TaxID=83891 RepID=A0A422QCS5_9TRYP|nr:uncharacterized protein Tco025E_00080 [Trypanosoma conorhini]RNF27696.1 hypothetical protein Tco025E_00080 [Trypanosoma conorhini]
MGTSKKDEAAFSPLTLPQRIPRGCVHDSGFAPNAFGGFTAQREKSSGTSRIHTSYPFSFLLLPSCPPCDAASGGHSTSARNAGSFAACSPSRSATRVGPRRSRLRGKSGREEETTQ